MAPHYSTHSNKNGFQNIQGSNLLSSTITLLIMRLIQNSMLVTILYINSTSEHKLFNISMSFLINANGSYKNNSQHREILLSCNKKI